MSRRIGAQSHAKLRVRQKQSPCRCRAMQGAETLLSAGDSGKESTHEECTFGPMGGAALRKCLCLDYTHRVVPYTDAWRWQRDAVEVRRAAVNAGEDVPDAALLLQHDPVYTLGTRSSMEHVLFDSENPPAALHRTERGGEVTYHGPGQLVMYPILNLRHQQTDLHWYLRSLEEVVIRTLRSSCGLEARRLDGLTGVWVGEFRPS